MTFFRLVFLLALGFSLSTLTSSLEAAPDNRLGMALLGAFVDSDGTLREGSGVTSAPGHSGTGIYDVTFDRDVSKCFVSITPRTTAAVTAASITSTGSNQVFVYINNATTGNPTNVGFSIVIFCPR